MAQLVALKRRIKSIQTTQKITHAMRLVSMSLYSRLDKQHATFNVYHQATEDLFTSVKDSTPTWNHPALHPKDSSDTHPLIIVASAAKGLCGAFHTNLAQYFEQNFLIKTHQQINFITIGQKAST